MKTIIAGSRDITDEGTVYDVIESAKQDGFTITEVVSGNADGVDSIGEKWAEKNDVPVEDFPYKEYLDEYEPEVAPLIRNTKMAEYADQLIAVWDGESSGTKDMIDKAKEHGLDVYVERTDNSSLEDFL